MNMTTTKKYSLPREFAEKWVAALRSGEYEQGEGRLCTDDGIDAPCFCCLGVAGIVSGLKKETLIGRSYLSASIPNGKVVPENLIGSAGSNSLPFDLSQMNDNGHSFIAIASWIEENVEFV